MKLLWFSRALPLAAVVAVVVAAGLGAISEVRPAAAHNADYSCYLKWWWTMPPDNQIGNMNEGISPKCASIPAGVYAQESGYVWVTRGPSGWAWYYLQHNPDKYVEMQLDGPPCGSTPSYPTCSGDWNRWGYWRRNPDGWKQQQINTYSGGPYWHRTGWF